MIVYIFIYNIKDTSFSSSGFAYLCQHFNNIPNLESFYSDCNSLTDYDIIVFCDNIHYISKLKELCLAENEISNVGGDALSKNLYKCQSLCELYIGGNKFTNEENMIEDIKQKHPNAELKIHYKENE